MPVSCLFVCLKKLHQLKRITRIAQFITVYTLLFFDAIYSVDEVIAIATGDPDSYRDEILKLVSKIIQAALSLFSYWFEDKNNS